MGGVMDYMEERMCTCGKVKSGGLVHSDWCDFMVPPLPIEDKYADDSFDYSAYHYPGSPI